VAEVPIGSFRSLDGRVLHAWPLFPNTPAIHMRHAILVTLGVTSLLLPTALQAQVIPSPLRHIETRHEVGFYAGYLYTNRGSLDLGPAPAPIFGSRYNIALTGPLQGEIGLSFSPTSRTVYARPGGAGGSLTAVGERDLVAMIIEGGLRFRLTGARTWRGLAPYAAATGGVVTNLGRPAEIEEAIPSDQRFQFGPSFAASLGLGSDFFVTERFSIRAEARDHFWRLTQPVGLTGTGERNSEWLHNFAISFGGALHF
jgi:hypothetical protein